MSARRFLVKRTAWLVLGVLAVVTLTFLFVALTPDPQKAYLRFTGGQAAVNVYEAAHNQNVPLLQRYVDWLGRILTLDLGRSVTNDRPVTALLVDSLATTALYVIPGILVATVLGLASGTLAGLKKGTWVDEGVTGFAYVGLGVPHFYIAGMLYIYVADFRFGAPPWQRFVAASGVLVVTLLAAQTRYTRAEIREFAGTDFIKLVKAKGASPLRIARHLLRNAALPLLTLFVAELLSVLVITSVVVEKAFRISGIGSLAFLAMKQRDMPVIIGVVLVVSVIGIVGTFLQDVLYTVLDPRLDFRD